MSSDDEGGLDLFREPDGYFEPEKPPTFASHRLVSGEELRVRLVGHNPLWGHHVWNAGRTISTLFEKHAATLVRGKTVLELGAGAGLPSLVCAISGAAKVVVTDYPDADLIENLRWNITNVAAIPKDGCIVAEGYLWGAPPAPLLAHLPNPAAGFEVLILADLLFNHSEHAKLVQSIQQTLARTAAARAFVFFSPYRPWLLQKDLAFFELAKGAGFSVRKLGEEVMEKVMFEEDPGDELLRRTVFNYELRWADLDDGRDA
ncbi:uncharacterized protein K452DRAFT_309742 [Aplosporella prunicola CBS 121167]|uniref:Protein N-terminal and lysine N-methyltransferase EFM7 n=1 Tax=Aplosporella prunicola CBS 121167 TaxID=1176127 RepID=A0A6A6B9C1_9PEZI|nr:uncharacterized protein K452DRAFT_309742 [Aplosporella prunicola CBS 121167]KAF2140616.1 hypothetical protein K452DRAFT_309742 [Aplosporella prunicola CBS 121167]